MLLGKALDCSVTRDKADKRTKTYIYSVEDLLIFAIGKVYIYILFE